MSVEHNYAQRCKVNNNNWIFSTVRKSNESTGEISVSELFNNVDYDIPVGANLILPTG